MLVYKLTHAHTIEDPLSMDPRILQSPKDSNILHQPESFWENDAKFG